MSQYIYTNNYDSAAEVFLSLEEFNITLHNLYEYTDGDLVLNAAAELLFSAEQIKYINCLLAKLSQFNVEYLHPCKTNETCIICYDNNKNEMVKTNCAHYFHDECASKWFYDKDLCPLCNQEVYF